MQQNCIGQVLYVYMYIMQHIMECNKDRLQGSIIVDAFKILYSSTISLHFADTSNSGWSITHRTHNQV